MADTTDPLVLFEAWHELSAKEVEAFTTARRHDEAQVPDPERGAVARNSLDHIPIRRARWESLETIRVYWGVRQGNIATVRLKSAPTGKRRALIPYLHSGLCAVPADRAGGARGEIAAKGKTEPNRMDPMTVLTIVSAFMQFLQIALPVIINAWNDFMKALLQEDDKRMTEAHNSVDKNREKKDEIIIAGQQNGREYNPKIANECLPKQPAHAFGRQAAPSPEQAGMLITCSGDDGTYQLLYRPDLAEHLSDKTTSNFAWAIRPGTRSISFQWFSCNYQANGGEFWGAFKLFEYS